MKKDYGEFFSKIQKYGNFYLKEKEVAQGLIPNPDVITQRNINNKMIAKGELK